MNHNPLDIKHLRRIKTGLQMKYARQRIKRGFADCDTWNMDCYLLLLLRDMLRYMGDHASGYPCSYDSFESWQTWLYSTADLFSSAYKAYNEDNNDEAEKSMRLAMNELRDHFFELWD